MAKICSSEHLFNIKTHFETKQVCFDNYSVMHDEKERQTQDLEMPNFWFGENTGWDLVYQCHEDSNLKSSKDNKEDKIINTELFHSQPNNETELQENIKLDHSFPTSFLSTLNLWQSEGIWAEGINPFHPLTFPPHIEDNCDHTSKGPDAHHLIQKVSEKLIQPEENHQGKSEVEVKPSLDESDEGEVKRDEVSSLSEMPQFSTDPSIEEIDIRIIKEVDPFNNIQMKTAIDLSEEPYTVSLSTKEIKVEGVGSLASSISHTTKKFVKKVIIVDGIEQTSEEIIENPDEFLFSSIEKQESDNDPIISEPVEFVEDTFSTYTNNIKSSKDSFSGPSYNQFEEPVIKEKIKKLRKEPKVEESIDVKEGNQSSFEIDKKEEVLLSGAPGESCGEIFGSSSFNVTTVQSSICRSVRKVRRVIKKAVIVDGKEKVTEEVIDEPEEVEISQTEPAVSISYSTGQHLVSAQENLIHRETSVGSLQTSVHTMLTSCKKVTQKIQIVDGKEIVTEEVDSGPEVFEVTHSNSPSVSVCRDITVDDSGLSDAPDITLNISHGQDPHNVTLIGAEKVTRVNQVVRSKRVVRKVIIVNGKEQISEEVLEDPEELSHNVKIEEVPFEEVIQSQVTLPFLEISSEEQDVEDISKPIIEEVWEDKINPLESLETINKLNEECPEFVAENVLPQIKEEIILINKGVVKESKNEKDNEKKSKPKRKQKSKKGLDQSCLGAVDVQSTHTLPNDKKTKFEVVVESSVKSSNIESKVEAPKLDMDPQREELIKVSGGFKKSNKSRKSKLKNLCTDDLTKDRIFIDEEQLQKSNASALESQPSALSQAPSRNEHEGPNDVLPENENLSSSSTSTSFNEPPYVDKKVKLKIDLKEPLSFETTDSDPSKEISSEKIVQEEMSIKAKLVTEMDTMTAVEVEGKGMNVEVEIVPEEEVRITLASSGQKKKKKKKGIISDKGRVREEILPSTSDPQVHSSTKGDNNKSQKYTKSHQGQEGTASLFADDSLPSILAETQINEESSLNGIQFKADGSAKILQKSNVPDDTNAYNTDLGVDVGVHSKPEVPSEVGFTTDECNDAVPLIICNNKNNSEKTKTDTEAENIISLNFVVETDQIKSESSAEIVEPCSVNVLIQNEEVNVVVTTALNKDEGVNVKQEKNILDERDNNDSVQFNSEIFKSPSAKNKSKKLKKRSKSNPDEHKFKEQTVLTDIKHRVSRLGQPSYKAILAHLDKDVEDILKNNLDKLQDPNLNENEKDSIIITTVTIISEYLETITYVILNIKNSNETAEEQMKKLEEAMTALSSLKKSVGLVEGSLGSVLMDQAEAATALAQETLLTARQEIITTEERANEINTLRVLVNQLGEDIETLERDQNTQMEVKLEVLDNFEESNNEYKQKLMKLSQKGEAGSAISRSDYNTSAIISLRNSLLQRLSMLNEYNETLDELEQVTRMAQEIVDSPIIVENLEHLQEEMQKHRKFFVNLTHCRSLVVSLEEEVGGGRGRALVERGGEILEKAEERAEGMALAASRWTLLTHGVNQERRWLGVALRRTPGLAGLNSKDLNQYIQLYQSLWSDLIVHHGRVTQLMSSCEAVQSLVGCARLEDEVRELQEGFISLRERAASDLNHLHSFSEAWVKSRDLSARLEEWLYKMETKKNLDSDPINIREFWEVKAEFEVYKGLWAESCNQFEEAVSRVAMGDEVELRQERAKLGERWAGIEDRVKRAWDLLRSGSPPSLEGLRSRLIDLKTALDDMHGVIKTRDQLRLYTERLQVLKDGVISVEEDLVRLGLLPAGEADVVAALQSEARKLSLSIGDELARSKTLEERLDWLSNGLSRVAKDQTKAGTALTTCQAALDQSREDIISAVEECEAICGRVEESWGTLMSLRSGLHSLPLDGLKVTVSPIETERFMSRLQDEHQIISERARNLLQELQKRAHLWDDYQNKLHGVKVATQQADYMMQLLTLQGSVDYNRLVTTTHRLKGVSETLESREGNLEELKGSADCLKRVVTEEVCSGLEAEVGAAVKEWEAVAEGLTELCSKYSAAAELWASAKKAQEELINSGSGGSIKDLEERKMKLAELEKAAREISLGVGAPVLIGEEVATLGRRMKEEIEEKEFPPPPIPPKSAQVLLTPSETLEKAKAQIDLVQEVLGEGDGTEVTERLVALRDQLVALGKTQAHIQTIKQISDSPNDVLTVLKVWQAVFRETFQEYHRVSAALIGTGDSSAVLKIWADYLAHVNQFLDSSLPDQYHLLTENNNLCQVHHNVLSCQQALLPTQKGAEFEEQLDSPIMEQFNSLTNLHNETLAKIMDRQKQVQDRMTAWEKYRKDQEALLSWLKSAEDDRNRLKLRYIQMKTINKTILMIQDLLERIPEGEAKEKQLHDQLIHLIEFCDKALTASLKVEHATIAHRISNLQAALQTWKEYLERMDRNIELYESQVNKIQKVLVDVQSELQNSEVATQSLPHLALQHTLESLEGMKNRLNNVESELEDLSSIKGKLKESLEPGDVKAVTQRVWLLGQQKDDLEHRISTLIVTLQHRLSTTSLYDKRHEKFMHWAEGVAERLDNMYEDEGTNALRRLETELGAEVALKRKEVEWLQMTAAELSSSEPPESERNIELTNSAKKSQETWQVILSQTGLRTSRLRSIIQGMSQLEIRIGELGEWLNITEMKLLTPIQLESADKKEIDNKMKDHEELQRQVEMKSSAVGEVLNLCEILIEDCDSCHVHLDTQGIKTAMNCLEKRWKGVCVNSAERKLSLVSVWSLIQQILNLTKDQEKWLETLEKKTETLCKKSEKPSHDQLTPLLNDTKNLQNEVTRSGSQGLSLLEELYAKLLTGGLVQVNPEVDLTSKAKVLLERWYKLKERLNVIDSHLTRELVDLKCFKDSHSRVMEALTAADALLTMAESEETRELSGLADTEAMKQHIEKVERQLEMSAELGQCADELGSSLTSRSLPKDKKKLEKLMMEYRTLLESVASRIEPLRPKMTISRAVEVDTLKFETDKSTQVDTLGKAPVLRKDAFIGELKRTCVELEVLLDTMQSQQSEQSGKSIGKAQSTLELTQHLSSTLIEQCSATKQEALVDEIESLSSKFQIIRNSVKQQSTSSVRGRLTCPLCSRRNWKQLDNDIWRLEQWLQYAEGTLSSQPSSPPSAIEPLEDIIQDHRELLLDLDSHKSLMVSLNIVGTHLAEHTDDEGRARELQSRLETVNTRWDSVCSTATQWSNVLQSALIHNDELHSTIEELNEWLEKTELVIRQSEPVDLTEPTHLIQAKYDKFKEVKRELELCEPRVRSLEELNEGFGGELRENIGEQGSKIAAVGERLRTTRLRLLALMRLTGAYVLSLGAALGLQDPVPPTTIATLQDLSHHLLDTATSLSANHHKGDDEVEVGVLVRCSRFLGRVMRASLPISALLLALMGAAALLPIPDEDPNFPCSPRTNNLFRTFAPLLRYPNGRPPI